jgi:hypothetical protein
VIGINILVGYNNLYIKCVSRMLDSFSRITWQLGEEEGNFNEIRRFQIQLNHMEKITNRYENDFKL